MLCTWGDGTAEAGKPHHFHSKPRFSNLQIQGLKDNFKILVKI